MIDEATAAGLAQAFLKGHAEETDLDRVVMGQPFELSDSYLVSYQTRRFVETGDINHALAGNLPVLVDKLTGETSYCSVEQYHEMVRLDQGS